ncbi:hypothetical protein CTheo_3419 [Ceratobasidium theobromae]|uniref:Transcription factor TFIIIC triple barrel domain-containing protein n=1 Tax=Ceratobasidium theobromae TaxID=1582974 RepID=A0A5N5QPD6_9AGAM|nr:hypothetical protein CTheo_3419 [Ceratobasidium theobromae]
MTRPVPFEDLHTIADSPQVTYLTFDLGPADPAPINPSSIRIAGLHTDTPFLQLGHSLFRGIHATALGTELIFTPDATHHAQSDKKVLFNPVALQPRHPDTHTDTHTGPATLTSREPPQTHRPPTNHHQPETP